MTPKNPIQKSALSTTAILGAAALKAAEPPSVAAFVEQIKSTDLAVRGPAWQHAGPMGAPAVKPLAEVMSDPNFQIARAAKRALWNIVRHAGRPQARPERRAVEAELVPLLAEGDPNVRREWLWMLSEIGGRNSVEPVAALLSHPDLREDARACLQRIPGQRALDALKSALDTVPADYKPAIAVSLRVRGEEVAGYPSEKLVPTKKTSVKPVVG